VEDVAPLGEGGVRSDDSTAAQAVTRRDDLIKQIGGLLVERKVTKFVNKCSAEHLLTNVKLSEMWS
jgi:hypothetical protein